MTLSKEMVQIKTLGAIAYEERNAGAAGIKPGMLCKVAADGDVEVHATEGGQCECLIALEDSLQGARISTAYTIAYPVRLEVFRPGEEFHGILEAGQNVSIGEALMSAGNGKFASHVDSGATIDAIVGYAMEAEDLSAQSAVDTLIHIRAK